jgi:hypothetical protein
MGEREFKIAINCSDIAIGNEPYCHREIGVAWIDEESLPPSAKYLKIILWIQQLPSIKVIIKDELNW